MKVILCNAVSIDGFIATLDDNTDWVNDDELFFPKAKEVGAVIFGRKTYDPGGEEYTVPECINFIATSHPEKYKDTPPVKFLNGDPSQVLKKIQQAGFNEVLLCGGSSINASFAKVGLIDEMILDIHPILLGQGKNLLGDFSKMLKLKLLSSKLGPEGIIQNHYKVINS